MNDFLIQRSNLHGNGLFATRNFAKGSVLFRFEGNKLTEEEANSKPQKQRDNFLQIGNGLYMDISQNPPFFVNHSCSPNVFLRVVVNTAFLLAAIPINAGDEITFDYSTSRTATDFSMICNCGKFGCRKIIGGWSSLPEQTKERYIALGIVPGYVNK